MSSTLNDTQRQQLQAWLVQRKAELLAELGEHQQDSTLAQVQGGEEGGDPRDPHEQAQQHESNAVRDAEATRDHDELVAVRAALQRIAQGSYGLCVDCGQPIALARLQAQPAALRCVACQATAERG